MDDDEIMYNMREHIETLSKKELKEMVMKAVTASKELFSQLRDATDLLNDCGYELIDGVWRDMEYYPDDLE
tara:strand:+ start:8108 stop:8320 length:213 start_codon:yes stop_codon:yes gene_type:complete